MTEMRISSIRRQLSTPNRKVSLVKLMKRPLGSAQGLNYPRFLTSKTEFWTRILVEVWQINQTVALTKITKVWGSSKEPYTRRARAVARPNRMRRKDRRLPMLGLTKPNSTTRVSFCSEIKFLKSITFHTSRNPKLVNCPSPRLMKNCWKKL